MELSSGKYIYCLTKTLNNLFTVYNDYKFNAKLNSNIFQSNILLLQLILDIIPLSFPSPLSL